MDKGHTTRSSAIAATTPKLSSQEIEAWLTSLRVQPLEHSGERSR
jgi:hypothetical protein